MADVTLSAAVRSTLLSLQNTAKLISQTQDRLSTGLKVSGATDDPVAFFQAKTLTDRARDFNEKKSGIDQGISTITAALDAVEGLENIIQQIKGLVLSAKSATTASQVTTLITQFNDLRGQINFLTDDAEYQGLNLVDGTGTTLTVQFSTDTASALSVNSVDLSNAPLGLNIGVAKAASGVTSGVDFNFVGSNTTSLSAGGTVTVTYAGTVDLTITSAQNYEFSYGTATITLNAFTAGATTGTFTSTQTITVGQAITFTLSSGGTAANVALFASSVSVSVAGITGALVFGIGYTTTFNAAVNYLDDNLETLRTNAQKLGTNVALLQTRLDFTENYVNTLRGGGDKLTLADLNEEGANLLALQTRQQLGISSLSFAGQAEQSILALFR